MAPQHILLAVEAVVFTTLLLVLLAQVALVEVEQVVKVLLVQQGLQTLVVAEVVKVELEAVQLVVETVVLAVQVL
jgi:hypothetical protein